jgi:hypothetical protein
MKTLQKFGGISAFFMALSHLVGIVIFLAVLNYAGITDPTQKLAVNMDNQMLVFSTNLMMYVIFGFALILLSLALHDRLKNGAPGLMLTATAVGIIWAGSLIASGMVANAGLASVGMLYAKDPTQAALVWQGIEAVANGLGNANGEILGGLWVLLVSTAALRGGGLPKALNTLGLLVGVAGILSLAPALTEMLIGLFGVGQIVWFVWTGIALLRAQPESS